jgi:hypothetical protein
MAEDAFQSPLSILPLMGGGFGIGHVTLKWSRFTHHDQRLPSRFQSPLAILPLMRGGGFKIVWCVKWGPSCQDDHRVTSPSHHLYYTQMHDGLVPIGRFSILDDFYSYWPSVDPVGIHPYGMHVIPSGLQRLQNRACRYCSSPKREIPNMLRST